MEGSETDMTVTKLNKTAIHYKGRGMSSGGLI